MPESERIRTHLAKPDHWTFLAAFGLVVANVRLRSRRVSAAAAALLGAALGYDVYEFFRDAGDRDTH